MLMDGSLGRRLRVGFISLGLLVCIVAGLGAVGLGWMAEQACNAFVRVEAVDVNTLALCDSLTLWAQVSFWVAVGSAVGAIIVTWMGVHTGRMLTARMLAIGLAVVRMGQGNLRPAPADHTADELGELSRLVQHAALRLSGRLHDTVRVLERLCPLEEDQTDSGEAGPETVVDALEQVANRVADEQDTQEQAARQDRWKLSGELTRLSAGLQHQTLEARLRVASLVRLVAEAQETAVQAQQAARSAAAAEQGLFQWTAQEKQREAQTEQTIQTAAACSAKAVVLAGRLRKLGTLARQWQFLTRASGGEANLLGSEARRLSAEQAAELTEAARLAQELAEASEGLCGKVQAARTPALESGLAAPHAEDSQAAARVAQRATHTASELLHFCEGIKNGTEALQAAVEASKPLAEQARIKPKMPATETLLRHVPGSNITYTVLQTHGEGNGESGDTPAGETDKSCG